MNPAHGVFSAPGAPAINRVLNTRGLVVVVGMACPHLINVAASLFVSKSVCLVVNDKTPPQNTAPVKCIQLKKHQ